MEIHGKFAEFVANLENTMARCGGMVVAAMAVLALSGCAGRELSVACSPEAAGRILAAAPGTTVVLGEGVYALGDLTMPAGVSLRGAGYGKTILDAGGRESGLVLTGGKSASFSDFTLRNTTGAGLVLRGAARQSVQRVAVRDCPVGVTVVQSEDCSLSNLVIADGLSGVSFVDSVTCSLVSATLANIQGTAVTVNGSRKVTIFNVLVAGAAHGIILGEGNRDLAIDHNIYNVNFVGRTFGQFYRKKVESWRVLTGYDRHSQEIGVTFADAAAGDFRVVSPLPWSPNRATTGLMGTMALAGVEAPATDMNGLPRSHRPDVGAFESSLTPPRKADGTFSVTRGAGVVSAGLFDKNDKNVNDLFQNLPLAKGTYEYWLPTRDWQGRPIPAGDYELRLLESDLKLEWLMAAGNGDPQTSKTNGLGKADLYTSGGTHRYSLDPQLVAFTDSGNVILTQLGFESAKHVRMFTPDMGEILWNHGRGGKSVGVAVDGDTTYVLRQQPGQPASLLRIRTADGQPKPFADGSFQKVYDDIKGAAGMTVLNGKMYVTETAANRVHILTGDELEITGGFDVEAPTQIAADAKENLLWVLIGGAEKKLIAWDPDDGDGVPYAPHGNVEGMLEQPTAIAANNGRLTVYSTKTNQVTLFEARLSHNTSSFFEAGVVLRKLRTIGVGGEGNGRIIGERFWSPSAIALGRDGRLAVVDKPRTIVFDADGKVVRQMLGMWGQVISYGKFAGDERWHFFNIGGRYDIILDAKKQTWEPGTYWKYTMKLDGSRASGYDDFPLFFYTVGDQTFTLFRGRDAAENPHHLYVIRMEQDRGVAHVLARYGFDKEGLFRQRADESGVIAVDAPKERISAGEGKAIRSFFIDPAFTNTDYRPDGSMHVAMRDGVLMIPMTGLDEHGIPNYDFTQMRLVAATADGKKTFTSPYDFTSVDDVSIAQDIAYFADGTFAAGVTTRSGPGPDLASEHASSTDLAGFDAAGNMRWFRAMNPFGLKMGFWGVTTMGDLNIYGRAAVEEWEATDRDGLGAGTLAPPLEMDWYCTWLDNHRQTQCFTGEDGQPYMIVGDYIGQAYHWLRLSGHDKLIRQSVPVTVSAALAETLANGPAQPPPVHPAPPAPKITIKRIDKDLPMDGDLAKWRSLGITPIVASPTIQTLNTDPRDVSAVIRLAWNGEDKLFVQVIRFDDVISFHQQESWAHFLQDGIEMNINVFYKAWKYNVTRMKGQDMIFRDTQRRGSVSGLLTNEQAPRKITVLDNAKDVEERKLLEAGSGVDMSGCKVMVVEFTLTPDAIAGMDADSQMEFGRGKKFHVGFAINDNDVPGSENYNAIVWPAMYFTFSRSENFAEATFE